MVNKMGTSATMVSCGMGKTVCEHRDEMGTTGRTADGKSREYTLRRDGKQSGREQDAVSRDSIDGGNTDQGREGVGKSR